MKKTVLVLISSLLLYGWEMKGINAPTIPNVDNGIVWWYDATGWHECCEESPYLKRFISGGSGYWSNGPSLQMASPATSTYNWQEGWNFVTPLFNDWDLRTHFKELVPYGWKYKNGEWQLFSLNEETRFPSFQNVEREEGVWLYIPRIDFFFDNLPLFCKEGRCTDMINTTFDYRMRIKVEPERTISFAYDLYRYSNDTHYKLAIGPLAPNALNTLISICASKGDTSQCKKFDNSLERAITYENGYLTIDAQKIASLYEKEIPNVKERFFMEIYVEGVTPQGFIPKSFGTIGIENFGTWVTLDNSVAAEFELEIR